MRIELTCWLHKPNARTNPMLIYAFTLRLYTVTTETQQKVYL